MKTLYFEGAGCTNSSNSDMKNCRIRTAFTNEDGRKIYLELTSREKTKYDKKNSMFEELELGECIGFIDFAMYIDTESTDPCNETRIKLDNRLTYKYDKESVLSLVNDNFNCKFDKIVVLPFLSGYCVHGEKRSYNLMDDYNHNQELIDIRETIHDVYYQLEKSEGKEYPNFSLWVDKENLMQLHLLRHFNGYNKHWTITIDSDLTWIVEETKLGRYAC